MSGSGDGGWKPRAFTPEQEALYQRIYGSLWRADEKRGGVPSRPPGGGWRSGVALSLVILRGKLQNTLAWVDDELPWRVETGTVQLRELRAGRVRELARDAAADWPRQVAALQAGISGLADDWATALSADRSARLLDLLALVDAWLADIER